MPIPGPGDVARLIRGPHGDGARGEEGIVQQCLHDRPRPPAQLAQGARTHPGLWALIPAPPAGVQPCESCDARGWRADGDHCFGCGGLGWWIPGQARGKVDNESIAAIRKAP